DDFPARVCLEWEAATAPAERAGIRVVHLRTGVVLSTRGGALAKQLTPFRMGLGGRVGNGKQYLSWIHIDDEVAALDAGAGWSRTAREALGYRELAAHLRGECTLDEAIDTAVTRTRRFAVRQQRWFGRDPRIRWFDAPRPGAGDGADGDGASVQRCAEDLLGYWSQVAAAGSGPAATVDPSCCD
ncbi:MAG TPA: hypothetical protein P5193_13240, partial [Microthrixaceae bacterium]|nr:hypothetical protein [Microthrixaceae bacterium]